MTIDNVPQARWLETAPPDETIVARFTKLVTNMEQYDRDEYVYVHMYFDTATDMIYKFTEGEHSSGWHVTDPNRKGIFA